MSATNNDRSPLQILASIGLGILAGFIITFFVGIELDENAKLIISITPPVVSVLWATRIKRIWSMRLWISISHGVVYGLINFFGQEIFFQIIQFLGL